MVLTDLGILMEVKPVQSVKADPPMLVTFDGNVKEVKPVQPAKALFSMLVTLEGIVKEVRATQFWNVPTLILVIPGIKLTDAKLEQPEKT